MRRGAPASTDTTRIAASAPLPRPAQLAALGTVLCLYRAQLGAELMGWNHALRVGAQLGVDSDGLLESLCFYDRQERCCWRLYLLPDSDFVAWDALLSALPAIQGGSGDSGELAASVASVSPLGASIARRIARLEAAEGEVLVDDCCCARAGRPVARPDPERPWPLLRL
jgi:hypothetical protein